MKKSRFYKIAVLVLLILAVGYYGAYRYFRDKLTPLDVSGYVNLFNPDFALQLDSVSYTFPLWIHLHKGVFYYNQEPVLNFDEAEISVGFFSIFMNQKKFTFDFEIADGNILGDYFGDDLEIKIAGVDLQQIPVFSNYKFKGVVNAKLGMEFVNSKISKGNYKATISNLGFTAKNDFVTDTSLNLGQLALDIVVKDSLLSVNKVKLSGKELELAGFGDVVFHTDKSWVVDFRGKKQFSPSFFDKIKNGFFIGLYLSDAIGKDCYFKIDYGKNGLDYRKIKETDKISELEEKLEM